MTDLEIALEFSGLQNFDANSFEDVMLLLSKIEKSKPNNSVWAEITPSKTRITDERRNREGERLRQEDGFYVPFAIYESSNKERNKKKHIFEACIKYIKGEFIKEQDESK